MKLRISLAAMLAVVAVLALGPATSSSAPGDNAVVHWSGVAASAIAVGRAPASSACSAAWFTVRCTTPLPPSREGWSRSRPA